MIKIAILSTTCWRTPPRHYGPWEQVASNIAEGLCERGLDVTLFATGDSITSGKLEYVYEHSWGEDPDMDPKVCECMHISHLMEMANRFDIIHNNYDFLPLTYSRLINTPMVTTIHGFSSPTIIPVYKRYNDIGFYVSISNSDRSPELNYISTVYNGIRAEDFTLNPKGGDYLLYFSRIHPDKGAYEAIKIAKKSCRRLIISGPIQDQAYFAERLKPSINNDDIVYVGNSGPEKRDKLLGQAFALVHPITFEEPFGLSVVESMLCGTPVVAFNKGSMPELILDGKAGFLVENIHEAVDALTDVKDIDRRFCRTWAEERFSQKKMIDDYIDVYKEVLGR